MRDVSKTLIAVGIADRVCAGSDGPMREPIRHARTRVQGLMRDSAILSASFARRQSPNSLYPKHPPVSAVDLRAHCLAVTTSMRAVLPHTSNFLGDAFGTAIKQVGWTKTDMLKDRSPAAFTKAFHSALCSAVTAKAVYYSELLGSRFSGVPAVVRDELTSLLSF